MMNLQNEEEEKDEQETEHPLTQVRSMKSVEPSTKLKDLFAPREEEGKCIQVLMVEVAQSTAGCRPLGNFICMWARLLAIYTFTSYYL